MTALTTNFNFIKNYEGDGFGMLHSQTKQLNGRKYWVWGNDVHDASRMNFLSSPGSGHYIEMQAGVAPTQSQTFTLGGNDNLEWTETISALQVDAKKVSGKYTDAVKAVNETVESQCNLKTFKTMDSFFSQIADTEVEEVLYNGSGWGALHEFMTGRKMSPGLKFNKVETSSNLTRPWYELLSKKGTFSNMSLSVPPISFLVDDAWVNIITRSMAKNGETWLHYVHLGIAAHHRSNFDSAERFYENAIRLNPKTIHGFRGMALLHTPKDPKKAWIYYVEAFGSIHHYDNSRVAERFEVSLARELLAFGISQPRDIVSVRQLKNFIDKNVVSSTTLKNDSQIEIAVAYVNLYVHNDFDGVLDYLEQSNVASTSTLTPIMLDLWQEAQWRRRSSSEGGKVLTLLEKVDVLRKFPPPPNIDFRGAT